MMKKGFCWIPVRRLAVFCALVLAAVLSAGRVTAQEEDPASPAPQIVPPGVNLVADGDWIGASPTGDGRISIDVPAYRGIEPQLALSYSPSTAGRLAGTGWDLSGLPVFERVSGNYGVPHYDSTDGYLFSAQRLVSCSGIAAGRSAGCDHPSSDMEAHYATEQQSLLRIGYDRDSNSWHVWDTSGVELVFADAWIRPGTGAEADRTFRWGLSRVVDLRGHEVRYSWVDDNVVRDGASRFLYRYLSRIDYDHHRVTFYYEDRSDHRPANNGGAFGSLRWRLRTIDVETELPTGEWQRVRAYALRYGDAP